MPWASREWIFLEDVLGMIHLAIRRFSSVASITSLRIRRPKCEWNYESEKTSDFMKIRTWSIVSKSASSISRKKTNTRAIAFLYIHTYFVSYRHFSISVTWNKSNPRENQFVQLQLQLEKNWRIKRKIIIGHVTIETFYYRYNFLFLLLKKDRSLKKKKRIVV